MPVSGRGSAGVVLFTVGLVGCPTPMPVVPALPEGSTSSTAQPGTTSGESSSGDPSLDSTSSSTGTETDTGTGTGDEDSSSSSGGRPVGCPLGTGEGCLAPQDGPSWMEGWSYRRRIQILAPSPPLSGVLFDAVVPVLLDDAFEYDCARPDGTDLRFVDETGMVLDHEIDEWEPEQGAVAWVRLPTLPTEGTELWLYYGNASTVGLDAEVWSPTVGYEAVLHFGGDLEDARGVHHGEPAVEGELVLYGDGRLGRAVHFEPVLVNSRVELTGSDLIDDAIVGSQSMTVSAWIRATPSVAAPQPYRTIASRGYGMWSMTALDTGGPPYDFSPPVSGAFITSCDLVVNPECTGYVDPVFFFHVTEALTPIVTDEVLSYWHHLAIAYEPVGGQDYAKRIYVDGEPAGEDIGPRPMDWPDMDLSARPLTIGTGPDDSALYVFHGEIDEFHVASEALSSDRIRAEFAFSSPDGPGLVQIEPPECQ